MRIIDLGLMEFSAAYALQEELAAEVAKGGGEEALLLLEHPSVYTIGSGGDAANVLDPSVAAIRINRGGDVTYHGPGQLVGYPLLDLSSRGKNLHHYLRFLEELVAAVSAEWGVDALREPGRTGIWVSGRKLASIGVGIRRWVTMHGFALNVSMDLTPFRRINPCGLPDCPITTLELECGQEVPVDSVKKKIMENFARLLHEWLPYGERQPG